MTAWLFWLNMKDALIVASRGRWKNDCWTQQYEVNEEGLSNTLTRVQKDNLVLEIYEEDNSIG